ncbi:MAG TPA: hypothetical protein VKA09_00380, partial [Nitrososphaeraceae archaeon]|nr:hypothetical protein [Nitrososphaeraceae archaeon]
MINELSFPDPVLPSYVRENMFCSSSIIAELKQLDILRNIYNFEMTAEIISSSNENHIQA